MNNHDHTTYRGALIAGARLPFLPSSQHGISIYRSGSKHAEKRGIKVQACLQEIMRLLLNDLLHFARKYRSGMWKRTPVLHRPC